MNLLRHPHFRMGLYACGLVVAFVLGMQVAKLDSSPTLPLAATPQQSSTPKSNPSTKAASALEAKGNSSSEGPHHAGGRLVPSSPNSRLSALIDYASKLDATQTLAALRKLDLKSDNPESKLARHVLVARYAELDPLTALTFVDTLSDKDRSEEKINALSSWASRDGANAADYFSNNALTGGIVSDEDVSSAAGIASEWAKRDPTAAWNWVSSLPPEARGEAVKELATQLAATNPTLALQAVAAMPEAYERAEAMAPLATQWAQTAPTKTAEWVASLRDLAQQSSAASGLVTAWMQTNPYAVSEWVSKLRPGTTRDAAITSMIRAQAVRNDPEAATYWAATVQDPTLREQLVSEVVKRWQIHDPDAAQRWLATNGR